MFGIVYRDTKEARVRCVLNNSTKENLLPIVKNNDDDNHINPEE